MLISVDDLRFDAVGFQQDKRYLAPWGLEDLPDTPNLDALAREGTFFNKCYSACSYTPPSHATMFTGLYPPAHGVRAFLTNGLSPDVSTLAEQLEAAGWRTIAGIDFVELFALTGLTRGFGECFKADDRRLMKLLDDDDDRPTFVFMHIVDVHPPYGESLCPPDAGYNRVIIEDKQALAGRLGLKLDLDGASDDRGKLIAASNQVRVFLEENRIIAPVALPRYLRGVNRFDRGRLAQLLAGFRDRGWLGHGALFIITSDHGQMPMHTHQLCWSPVGEKFDHGEAVHEQLVRVPLVLAGDKEIVGKGAEVDTPVSLVDLAPTILEAAGVACEKTQGTSLLATARGEGAERAVYAEAHWHDRLDMRRVFHRCREVGRLENTDYHTFLYMKMATDGRRKLCEFGDDLTDDDYAIADDETFARRAVEKILAERYDLSDYPTRFAQLKGAGALDRRQWVADLEKLAFRRRALYDLERDPWETANLLLMELASPGTIQARGLRGDLEKLQAFLDRVKADAAPGQAFELPAADARVIEDRLRDLGYID